jgi:hypothetical protein
MGLRLPLRCLNRLHTLSLSLSLSLSLVCFTVMPSGSSWILTCSTKEMDLGK